MRKEKVLTSCPIIFAKQKLELVKIGGKLSPDAPGLSPTDACY
jgi:hypothetical protein